MQTRALVKERAQRNLLLLIDGIKTDEVLLASVTGAKPEDFGILESLKLIVASAGASSRGGTANDKPMAASNSGAADTVPAGRDDFLDYPKFTATLTQLISSELGLRGFTLTLAVEKAGSIEELRAVADRVLEQIRDRKGAVVADKARRSLYGG